MVRWYFISWSTYGFWLPNDQRGSGSVYVGSKALLPYGLATKVNTRRSVAWKRHDPVVRRLARESLEHDHVVLTDAQIEAVGRGFATVFNRLNVPCHACAVMPDHTHLVTGRPPYSIEQLVIQLKGAATARLKAEGIHPFQHQPQEDGTLPHVWARGEWKVFINEEPTLLEKIDYTEKNPIRAGRPRQQWEFVTPYNQGGCSV